MFALASQMVKTTPTIFTVFNLHYLLTITWKKLWYSSNVISMFIVKISLRKIQGLSFIPALSMASVLYIKSSPTKTLGQWSKKFYLLWDLKQLDHLFSYCMNTRTRAGLKNCGFVLLIMYNYNCITSSSLWEVKNMIK
jgi:hypothetical protein